ncbi:hypothetical protein [Aquihabitans sp. G128]|uniref:hypothetical protein n=1 Tax=Aquihabitans sp. G128 TaxID=2849779 RepID=UPI0020B3945B|nr:hypothetical protein [Aquihabitans sp. G128]
MQAETLESIRVGVHAPTIWRNVDRFQALGEESGKGITLSFCVMADNWRETLPFLLEADRRGVNGNVIFVNQPHRHDLLRLPRHELEAVLAELAPLPAPFRSELVGRNWQEVLDRVRSQIEHPVELVLRSTPVAAPVAAPSRAAGPPAPDRLSADEVAALRRRLADAYGCEPLDLRFEDEVVAGADVPTWAEPFGARSWPGLELAGLQDALELRVGPVAPGWLPSDDPRIATWVLVVGRGDERQELHAHRFAEAAGPERTLLYVAAPAT